MLDYVLTETQILDFRSFDLRILFLGDMVGRRPYRGLGTAARPDQRLQARFRRGQWRERRRRLRHHRRDLSRTPRRRRRCGDHRQPCLGPARGAGIHRACASASATGQFSRPARRAAVPASYRPRTAPGCWSPTSWAGCSCTQLDDPFQAVDRELAACPLGEQADAVVIDFHAEATSEKVASAISSTAAPAWWSAPTPISRPPTIRS